MAPEAGAPHAEGATPIWRVSTGRTGDEAQTIAKQLAKKLITPEIFDKTQPLKEMLHFVSTGKQLQRAWIKTNEHGWLIVSEVKKTRGKGPELTLSLKRGGAAKVKGVEPIQLLDSTFCSEVILCLGGSGIYRHGVTEDSRVLLQEPVIDKGAMAKVQVLAVDENGLPTMGAQSQALDIVDLEVNYFDYLPRVDQFLPPCYTHKGAVEAAPIPLVVKVATALGLAEDDSNVQGARPDLFIFGSHMESFAAALNIRRSPEKLGREPTVSELGKLAGRLEHMLRDISPKQRRIGAHAGGSKLSLATSDSEAVDRAKLFIKLGIEQEKLDRTPGPSKGGKSWSGYRIPHLATPGESQDGDDAVVRLDTLHADGARTSDILEAQFEAYANPAPTPTKEGRGSSGKPKSKGAPLTPTLASLAAHTHTGGEASEESCDGSDPPSRVSSDMSEDGQTEEEDEGLILQDNSDPDDSADSDHDNDNWKRPKVGALKEVEAGIQTRRDARTEGYAKDGVTEVQAEEHDQALQEKQFQAESVIRFTKICHNAGVEVYLALSLIFEDEQFCEHIGLQDGPPQPAPTSRSKWQAVITEFATALFYVEKAFLNSRPMWRNPCPASLDELLIQREALWRDVTGASKASTPPTSDATAEAQRAQAAKERAEHERLRLLDLAKKRKSHTPPPPTLPPPAKPGRAPTTTPWVLPSLGHGRSSCASSVAGNSKEHTTKACKALASDEARGAVTEETPLCLNTGYAAGEFQRIKAETAKAENRKTIEQIASAVQHVGGDVLQSVLRYLCSNGKIDTPGSTDPLAQSVPAFFYQLKKWATQVIANQLRDTCKSQFAGSHAYVTPQECEKLVVEVSIGKLDLEKFKKLAHTVGSAGRISIVVGSADELNSAWQLARLVMKAWLHLFGGLTGESGLTSIDRHLLLSGKQGGIAVKEMEHFIKLVATDWEDAIHQYRQAMEDSFPDLEKIVANHNSFLVGEAAHAHAMRRMDEQLATWSKTTGKAQSAKAETSTAPKANDSRTSTKRPRAARDPATKPTAQKDKIPHLSQSTEHCAYVSRDKYSDECLQKLRTDFTRLFGGYCRAYHVSGCPHGKACKHKHQLHPDYPAYAEQQGVVAVWK